jgi:protein involved in ribonucleotide reduction
MIILLNESIAKGGVIQMLVAFASLTGNIKRFANKLDFETIHIKKDTMVDEPFVLITYSIGRGEIPKEVQRFIDNNGNHMKAVIGSGNRIWGDNFCRAAKLIAERYTVPLLHTFEVAGYAKDVELVTEKIQQLEGMK